MRFPPRTRRILTGAAAGALVLGLLPAGVASADTEAVCADAPDSGFPDKGDTHGANIDCMHAYGVIDGRTDGTFGTFDHITRGASAKVFLEFALAADHDLDVPEEGDPFTDKGNVFDEEINGLWNLGLIDGVTETTFEPAANIVRGQFAKILFEAHEALGVEFDDDYPEAFDDTGDTYRDEVNALAGEGIISGFGDGTFGTWQPITRGAAISLLAESAGYLYAEGLWDSTLPPVGDLATYTDAPELIRVEHVSQTDTQVRLRFVFDEDLQPGPDADAFHLVRGDTTVTDATDAARVDGNSDQVVADFDRSAYEQATTAAVSHEAVADIDGLANPEAAFALQAVTYTGGVTEVPDLVDVDWDADSDEITFTYDAGVTLDPIDGIAGDLRMVSEDGSALESLAGELDADDDTVTWSVAAGFEDADADEWVRAVSSGSSVQESDLTQVVSLNGASAVPDLVGVDLDTDEDTVTYTFDQNIVTSQAAVDSSDFAIYAVSGSSVTGTGDVGFEDDAVTVSFGDGEVHDAIVGAWVEAAAVQATDATPAQPDAVGVDQAFTAGTTTGPLVTDVEVAVDEAEELDGSTTFDDIAVTYTFSQDVTLDDAGFHLTGADGTRHDLQDGATLDGAAFDCTADGDTVACTSTDEDNAGLADAPLATIANDAVVDADIAVFTSHPDGEGVS